jgi:hypothetical protein
MDEEMLRQYLLRAAAHGYADKESERSWTKERDGSTTITHADAPWRLHDNFFGGEPYGGREVVFFEERPFWMMVYYGSVDPTTQDFQAVYAFLQDALRSPDEFLPVRGPHALESGDNLYEAEWEGKLTAFQGLETIRYDGQQVYRAVFAGGLVDVRREPVGR